MQYKIGEVYDFDGQKRKVIGTDGNYPVTTAVLELEVEQPVASKVDVDAIRTEMRAELEAEIRSSIKGEQPAASVVDVDTIRAQLAEEFERDYHTRPAPSEAFRGLISLLPLDKCNKEELTAVAAYIGKEITSGDPSKAEIIAIILGD